MASIWTMGELLCEVMRPQADMPLHEAGEFIGPFPSGAPAIFIDTVARLGVDSGIIGGVGNDDFGKCLRDRLEKDGVDISQIQIYEDGTTGVAFITYFQDGSRRFLYHFPDTPATRVKAPQAEALGEDVAYFHIMGCSLMAKKEFGQEIVKLMKALALTGTKISFDPNIRPELMKDETVRPQLAQVMEHCSIFMPGVSELLAISGKATVEESVKAVFENPKLEIIVLKNGSRGCTIYTRETEIALGIYQVETVDPTGAGDCFDAAFLCGLLEGKSLEEAAKEATAAAALNTMVLGPMEGAISRENVATMLKEKTLIKN